MKPDFQEVQVTMGFIYFRQKKLDQAFAAFDTELRQRPKDFEALYGRGLVRRAKGDAVGAQADIAQATSSDPQIAMRLARQGMR